MNTQPETQERRYTRVQLPIPVEIFGESVAEVRRPAHLRDISAGGAFLYANLQPGIGAVLRVNFIVPGIGNDIQISCEGRVVRVEAGSLGELSGIAVAFDRLSLGPW
jgi:c-di-GMP-binding flagellar brake protein YcgR